MSGTHLFTFNRTVAIGLVIGIALSLRFYRLGHENFWIDEIYQIQVASQSIQDIVLNYKPYVSQGKTDQAPLSFLVTHFFVSPENPEWMARLPSAVFGTLEVLALFIFGAQLFSYRVALLAAIFMTLSPLHLWYSQEARWYAQWSFITTVSYIALLNTWKSGRTSTWIIYGLLILANIYTFIFSFFVIVSQTISVWRLHHLKGRKTRFLVNYMCLHFLLACAALPVLWVIFAQVGGSTGTTRPTELSNLPYTFFAYSVGFSSGPTLGELHALPSVSNVVTEYPSILILFIVYFPVLILGMRKVIQDSLPSAVLIPWLFGLPVLAFLVGVFSNISYNVRYTYAALPAYLLILAAGALSSKSNIAKSGIIAAVLLCSLSSLAKFYWDSLYDKENIRAATAYLEEKSIDGSSVLSVGQIGRAVKYYGDHFDMVSIDTNKCNGETDREDPLRQRSMYSSKAIWVITGRDWNNRVAACLDRLSQSHAVTDHQSFSGIKLWLLKLRE